MRCETEIEPFNTVVVMFTLRETGLFLRVTFGRSPDLRCAGP